MAGCFQIDERDNMATLLRDAAANEELQLRGADRDTNRGIAHGRDDSRGHKVALAVLVAATASGAATKPEAPEHREYFLMYKHRDTPSLEPGCRA